MAERKKARIDDSKAAASTTNNNIIKPVVPVEKLSAEQREIIDLVSYRLELPTSEMLTNPLNIFIQSSAGCGKSCVLQHIKYKMDVKRRENAEFDYKMSIFLGVCAFANNCSTINSNFKIPVLLGGRKRKTNLADCPDVRSEFTHVYFLIFDEIFLVGINLIKKVDLFMRRVDPSRAHLPFANRNVIICGDILQPLPVCDLPLFHPSIRGAKEPTNARIADWYDAIEQVFILSKSFCQNGVSEKQIQFREFLERLRFGKTTPNDVHYLRQILKANLSTDEQSQFDNHPHVFPYRSQVKHHNRDMIRKKFPRQDIVSFRNGRENLDLAISSPVIITRNLSIYDGLTNGSQAKVLDILFKTVDGVETQEVESILVKVHGYRGRDTFTNAKGCGKLITKIKEIEFCNVINKYVEVEKFPLASFYAMTAHKCQGLTLEKLSIFLGKQQVFTSMDYMTMARVKSLDDLQILDHDIADDRLSNWSTRTKKEQGFQMRELTRLEEMANLRLINKS